MSGYYITLLSIHGLVRGTDPEYGRDADTGGQVRYVLELAEALADHHQVKRVDILTRRIVSTSISTDYAKATEQIAPKVFVERLDCGPPGYLAKEKLWPYLHEFSDAVFAYFHQQGRTPDVIHSHYADSGLVARMLSQKLKIPHIHTSHSLGRVKQANLRRAGFPDQEIEAKFKIYTRIVAEEKIFRSAQVMIASTLKEIEEQYCLYRAYEPRKIALIPPGVDTSVFRPPGGKADFSIVLEGLKTQLKHPNKAVVLAIARPDESKNIAGLIKTYAEKFKLRELSNLVIVSGKRQIETSAEFEPNQASDPIHHFIETCGLEGQIAIFEALPGVEIVDFYQFAFLSGGVFVNPAFNEPFGLTLLEAAAVGLPVIATHNAGPKAIVEICQNGYLVNPFNTDEIGSAVLELLSNKYIWQEYSRRGIQAVSKFFSWEKYVNTYLAILDGILSHQRRGEI